jgi:hypothetical protein
VAAYWSLDGHARKGEAGEAIFQECEKIYDCMLDAGLQHPLESEYFIYPELSSPRYLDFEAIYWMNRSLPSRILLFIGKRIQAVYRRLGMTFVDRLDDYPEPFRPWRTRR